MDGTPNITVDHGAGAGIAGRAEGLSPAPPPTRERTWHRAILPFVAAIAILVAASALANLSVAGLSAQILALPAWVFAGIVFAQFATVLIGSYKWKLALAGTGAHIGLRDAVAATSLGVLLGQFLPMQVVTPLSRAWIATRAQIDALRSVSTSLVEQATEVLVLCLMVLFGVAMGASGQIALPVVALLIGALLLAFGLWRNPGGWTTKVLAAADVWVEKAGGPKGRLSQTRRALSGIGAPLLGGLIGLGAMRFVLFAALNVVVLALLVPRADPLILLASYPVVLLLMSLPIFPGGLGVVEATWSGVLIAQGIPAPEAFAAAIALRIVSTAGFLVIAPILVMLRSPVTGDAR